MNKKAALVASAVMGFAVLAAAAVVGVVALVIYTFKIGGLIAIFALAVSALIATGWYTIYESERKRGES